MYMELYTIEMGLMLSKDRFPGLRQRTVTCFSKSIRLFDYNEYSGSCSIPILFLIKGDLCK